MLTQEVSLLSGGVIGKKFVSEGGQSHPIRSMGSWLQLSQSPSPRADRVGHKGLGQLPETLPSCGLSFETLGLQGPDWMVTLVGRAQGAHPWVQRSVGAGGRPGAAALSCRPYPSPEDLGQLHQRPGCPALT